MRNGYLTPTFSRPDKRAGVQVTPAFLTVSDKGDKKEKWLPHPCTFGGPPKGGNDG